MAENVEQSQSQEAQIDNTDAQVDAPVNEGTQDISPDVQAEASKDIGVTTEAVGLSKPEQTEADGDSVDVAGALSDLVSSALSGELTDEQRQSIDEAGLGQHFDMIVAGHKAQQEANDREVISVVGDEKAYAELQEWAVANLSDSEIDAFNKAVLESGDIGIAKLAVEGLQARYAKVNGQAPSKVIESGGSMNTNSRAFTSVDEYISETMTMKYKQDPEYAAEVEKRREISGF